MIATSIYIALHIAMLLSCVVDFRNYVAPPAKHIFDHRSAHLGTNHQMNSDYDRHGSEGDSLTEIWNPPRNSDNRLLVL